ncbi:MAG: DNA-directed RNA polymerase subunit omega [Bacteroidales bacterium]|nr:DNA-directed RNA polymerase subunit omega [Bacteroidales bacterium]MCF8326727.1 DNA-directed RNA polymerase subunit omega [Bacteroidales bacterium]
MDYKKVKTDFEAVTHRVEDFSSASGNIYETVVALSKRADQIASELKEELDSKIEEFTSQTDNLEEVFENREQIEIARFYERMPKPHILSKHEFLNGAMYIRNPHKNQDILPESGGEEA